MPDVKVMPLVLLGLGTYLAWFGTHYWRSDTRWPSDPVKAVLQGRPVPAADTPPPRAAATDADIAQAAGAVTGGQPGPGRTGLYGTAALSVLWTSQGGSPSTAFEAANVALAESSGDPDATSSNPDGGTNVGLWQLDTRGVGAGYTVEQLKDPAVNARLTVMHTANGTNWSQWADAVVKNGQYTGPKA